jgi:hypothetical protein
MGETFWNIDFEGNRIRDNKRMLDRELALRFCAFSTVPISEYSRATSLDAFLLEFTRRMYKQPSPDLDLTKLTAEFDQAMTNCFAIMGQSAFRYWPPQATRRGPLSRAIFESQAIALAAYPLATLLRRKDDIYNTLRSLFNDPDYDGAVRAGTGDFRKVSLRISLPRDAIARILS